MEIRETEEKSSGSVMRIADDTESAGRDGVMRIADDTESAGRDGVMHLTRATESAGRDGVMRMADDTESAGSGRVMHMGIRELKRRARRELRGNYVRCVVAGMIYIVSTFGAVTGNIYTAHETYIRLLQQITSLDAAFMQTAGEIILGYFSWQRILAYMTIVFLWNPLETGARRFFIDNALTETGRTQLRDIPYALRDYYFNKVWTMLLRDITIALHMLLFIVPGIIKAYSYRMVPLLLAEYPDLPAREIFRRSETMMRGSRLRLFRLELSFIGWNLLSSVTSGVPYILYAAPMLNICYANFYNELIESQAEAA